MQNCSLNGLGQDKQRAFMGENSVVGQVHHTRLVQTRTKKVLAGRSHCEDIKQPDAQLPTTHYRCFFLRSRRDSRRLVVATGRGAGVVVGTAVFAGLALAGAL